MPCQTELANPQPHARFVSAVRPATVKCEQNHIPMKRPASTVEMPYSKTEGSFHGD